MFDRAELYLDVNDELEDQRGPATARTNGADGHYHVQPGFSDGGGGKVQSLAVANERPGGSACYELWGKNYVYEYALDSSTYVNLAGEAMSVGSFSELDSIGFDVYIIDQDEVVTTTRHRAVWHNTGVNGENFANMDDAGTITLVDYTSVSRLWEKRL